MYFFSWNFIYFQEKGAYPSTDLVKFDVRSQKSEILHFVCSFCPNDIKFQLKKYTRVISDDIKEWSKAQRKTDFWFQIYHEEIGECSTNYWKGWKFHFDGLFCPKYLELKKYREVIFMTLKSDVKFE